MGPGEYGPQPTPDWLGQIGALRMPKELADRITAAMQLSDFGSQQELSALQPIFDKGTAIKKSADMKLQQLDQARQAALPVNAALLGLNKAVGSFAEILAPGKGFAASAEQRRQDDIAEMKARRAEHLKSMEMDALNEAKRADEYGDFEAKTKAQLAAEKIRNQRATLVSTNQEWYKEQAAKDSRIQTHLDHMDEIRAKYKAEMEVKYGKAASDPAIKFKLAALDNVYKSQKQALVKQLDALKTDYSDQDTKDQKANDILGQMAKVDADYMQQHTAIIDGVKKSTDGADTPAALPETPEQKVEVARQIVGKYVNAGHFDPSTIINDIQLGFKNKEKQLLSDTEGVPQSLVLSVARNILNGPEYSEWRTRRGYLEGFYNKNRHQVGNREYDAQRYKILSKALKEKYGMDTPAFQVPGIDVN